MDFVKLFFGLASLTLGILSGFGIICFLLVLNLGAAIVAANPHPDGLPRTRPRDFWCLASFLLLPGLLAWGAAFNWDAWEPGGSPVWAGPVCWLAVFVPPAVGLWMAWYGPGLRWFHLSVSALQMWVVYCTALVSFESVTGCWL
jgi:hypothetical protein